MTQLPNNEAVPYKKLRYVEVDWVDANTNNAWTPIQGEKAIEVQKVKTRGWVMKHDAQQIMICSTISLTEEGDVEEANATIAIPVAMVTQIRDLTVRERVRKRKPADQLTAKDIACPKH